MGQGNRRHSPERGGVGMRRALEKLIESNFFSAYRKYFAIFYSQLGNHLFFLLALSCVSITLEGFGFLMVLPLFGIIAGDAKAFGEMPPQMRSVFDSLQLPQAPYAVVGIIIGLFALKGLVAYTESIYGLKISRKQQLRVREDLLKLYGGLDYRQILSRNAGSMMQITRTEAEVFFRSTWTFIRFNVRAIAAFGYVVFAFVVNWYFSLIAIASGTILVIAFSVFSILVRRSSRRVSQRNRTLEKMMLQTFQSLRYLTGTNRFSILEGRVMGELHELAREQYHLGSVMAANQSIKEPLLVIVVTTLVTFETLILRNPVGPMIVALALFYRALSTILALHGAWQQVLALTGGFETTMKEVNALRAHQEVAGSQSPVGAGDGIRFDHVSFSYTDSLVLDDINLHIAANSTVAFVGASGSGKSTLLSLLTLQLRPDRGSIRINGIPHTELDLAVWRSRIGYVTQDTVIFDETIAHNITLWETDRETECLRARMVAAATKAHCHHFIAALPEGYDTVAGDRGIMLSGGQKQRLFIARELFREPDILLMDEATSALDGQSESDVQQSITEMKGTMTVILVAHRLSTVRNADVIHVLERGRIVESGTFDELINLPESRFRAMAQLQDLLN